MKKTAAILGMLFLVWVLASCQNQPESSIKEKENEMVELDTLTVLQHLRERGKLVAVTNCGIINYNTESGEPSGFEYELLSGFCKANDLELEMRVNENLDSCYQLLDSSEVDISRFKRF